MKRALVAAALALACAAAQAAGPADAPWTEAGVSHTRESLSNQPQNWTDTQLELAHRFADRKLLIGRLNFTERFGLSDRTATIAGYHPLGERTMLYAEGSASDTHRVLPRGTLYLQLAHTLGGGWGALGGVKRAHYNDASVTLADFGVERYIGNFRLALAWIPSHSSAAGDAASVRAQAGYYYGERSNAQLVWANGDEVDTPTAAGVIGKTSVRSVALYGQHWFAPSWALTYVLGRTHQGAAHRDAAGLGLRHRF